MRRFKICLLTSLALFCAGQLFFAPTAIAANTNAYVETGPHHSWFWLFFRGPKKNNPKDQMEYAYGLMTNRQFKAASSEYRALVQRWPNASEAPQAQYMYAQLLESRGKYVDAFDAYQYLIEKYAPLFPYDAILEKMFSIAERVVVTRRAQFLFFPGFSTPEQAVPLYEAIVSNAPQWELSPLSQYRVGQAYDQGSEFDKAITAYTLAMYRYPGTSIAERSAFAKASDLYIISETSPNDKGAMDAAWAALTVFINTHPNSELKAQALAYRTDLFQRRSHSAYEKARYYDKLAHKPSSAILAYQRFIQEYPHSDWTTLAESRIKELSDKVAENKK